MKTETPQKPSHVLFHVEQGGNGEKYWHKVGAMWPTKDGGFTVDISPFDVSGKLAARPRELLEQMREERKNQNGQDAAPEIAPQND
jgi:hypothetical protein